MEMTADFSSRHWKGLPMKLTIQACLIESLVEWKRAIEKKKVLFIYISFLCCCCSVYKGYYLFIPLSLFLQFVGTWS